MLVKNKNGLQVKEVPACVLSGMSQFSMKLTGIKIKT